MGGSGSCGAGSARDRRPTPRSEIQARAGLPVLGRHQHAQIGLCRRGRVLSPAVGDRTAERVGRGGYTPFIGRCVTSTKEVLRGAGSRTRVAVGTPKAE